MDNWRLNKREAAIGDDNVGKSNELSQRRFIRNIVVGVLKIWHSNRFLLTLPMNNNIKQRKPIDNTFT